MATADTEASTVLRAGWLRRAWDTWQNIAGILAVIALVDVSAQLIKWAAWICLRQTEP